MGTSGWASRFLLWLAKKLYQASERDPKIREEHRELERKATKAAAEEEAERTQRKDVKDDASTARNDL